MATSPTDFGSINKQEAKVYDLYLKLLSLEKRYEKDPWLWMCEEVMTLDEASQEIRPFPREKNYLKTVLDVIDNNRLIAIPKSRRMFVTWLLAAYDCWSARFHANHAILWQAQNQEKSAYVLDKRCSFIEDHLQTEQLKKPYSCVRTTVGLIGRITYNDTKSWIQGVPQGADVFRSYTPSILVMDECDFQPEAPAALAAAMPLAEKGAKLILVSTSNGPGGPLAQICKEIGFLRYS